MKGLPDCAISREAAANAGMDRRKFLRVIGHLPKFRMGCSIMLSSSDNLNKDSFRILDMKPRIKALFRIGPALFQFSCH